METFVTFFIILVTLVVIHELGHFLMAKKVDIYVEEFGLGIPPRAWGKWFGETFYSLNWLPIGGFVRLYGEDASEEGKYKVQGKEIDINRAFYRKSPAARAAVVLAGVVMNFILAVIVFGASYSFTGIPELTDRVQVLEVAENSPAAQAGLEPLDVVVSVNTPDGETVQLNTLDEFTSTVKEYSGQELGFMIERGGEQFEATMLSRTQPPEGEGSLGVLISREITSVFYSWYEMPFRGAWEGLKEAFGWSMMLLSALGGMVSGLFMGQVPKDVGGPVAIYEATGQVVDFGFWAKMRFMGILSVNLAVVNILPLPALDGGRLWFILSEWITGKKVPMHIERFVHTSGMVFLMGLILLVTIGDFARIFGWDIAGMFSQML